ncbi:SH3 domain-containing protein [Spirulina sp. CS-785/01]|uniref:SH3 domain-containing protein n=1 Tax=Spirulina sp. CS-785/01 TaxID=3021716 RepID=UPI0023308D22|nr:SH3 domain-containing protein [Spirulina sp. CS-785/01]MDB9313447.1 SH3 domain-containing protein [Spirulina sp. CS-785/01]
MNVIPMKHWHKSLALVAFAVSLLGEGAVLATSSSPSTNSPPSSAVTQDASLLSQRRDRFDRLGREGDCRLTERRTGIYETPDGEDRIQTLPEGTVLRLEEDNRNYDYIEVSVLGEDVEGYVSTRDLIPCRTNTLEVPRRYCQEVTETVTLYDGPGTNYERLERITRGDEFTLEPGIASFEDADGNEWVQITTRFGLTGWIIGERRGRSILRDCR